MRILLGQGLKALSLSTIAISIVMGSTWTIAASQTDKAVSFETAFEWVKQLPEQQQLWQNRYEQVELNLKQSQLWQNPTLNIEQTGFGDDQEFSMGISQPLDIFGQKKVSYQIAQLVQQKTSLQQQFYDAQLKLIVRNAWVQAMLMQIEQSVFLEQKEIGFANLNAAKKRYQAGSIALVDYERVQIEYMENQRMLDQAILNTKIAQQQLGHLWQGQATKAEFDSSQIWPVITAEMSKKYLEQEYLIQQYHLDEQMLYQQINQIKVDAKPNPAINFGINRTKAQETGTENVLVLGVEVPLNIFNRQQYQLPLSNLQSNMQLKQQTLQLQQQQQHIQTLLTQLDGLSRQYQNSQQQISLAEQVQKRTLQGFSVGKLSITDVQQANLQLQNVRMAKTQLLKEAWRITLTIQAMNVGWSLEQISAANALVQLNQKTIEQTQDLIKIGGK